MSFDSFGFNPSIVAGISVQGFKTPTPIQQQAIPTILEKKDLFGIAQTGTGKTAAFVLPILEGLLQGPRREVRAVIMAPTRELASQIDEVFRALGKETGLRSVVLFGGVPIAPQIRRLEVGVEIVVACPGRLLDHMKRGSIDLSKVEVLVLDEADQMFDMGFLPDIRKIVSKLPCQRQSLLFSATMPEDIRKLADKILTNPIMVRVGHCAPPQSIEHSLYPIAYHQKTKLLLGLFKQIEVKSILVFTRTKHRAKRLACQLDRSGYDVASLQGNLSQNRRKAAMEGFRKGKYQILVATDIAARGIDISTISHVINYDIPSTAEIYTHRIGRTGRARRRGEAFTLVTDEDKRTIKAIERLLGEPLERRKLKDFDYQEARKQRHAEAKSSTRVLKNKPSRKSRWGGRSKHGSKHPDRRHRTQRARSAKPCRRA